jgi:ComF family protein
MSEKKLYTPLKKATDFILDLFFPIRCIACGKEGNWLCESCLARIPIHTEHLCGVCEKVITPDGRTCQNCKKKSALSGLVVTTSYKNPTVAKAIHLYKYRFISDLHQPLGNLLTKSLAKTDLPIADIIIPIPLHSRRLRWRGFNQSTLLAKYIAENLLPQNQLFLNEKILIRKKYTPPQMRVRNYTDRQRNILDAFSLIPTANVKNKTILLVDDIATTGSTIFECARVLKKAGAIEIFAIVVARQEIEHKNS